MAITLAVTISWHGAADRGSAELPRMLFAIERTSGKPQPNLPAVRVPEGTPYDRPTRRIEGGGGAVPGVGALDQRSTHARSAAHHGAKALRSGDQTGRRLRRGAARVQRCADAAPLCLIDSPSPRVIAPNTPLLAPR